jgi:hypothetical protein
MEKQHEQEKYAHEHTQHNGGKLKTEAVENLRHDSDVRPNSRRNKGLTFPNLSGWIKQAASFEFFPQSSKIPLV